MGGTVLGGTGLRGTGLGGTGLGGTGFVFMRSEGGPHFCVLGISYSQSVKDMGQQMGYRSLEWNWPKEAMKIPVWAGIVDGAKLF